MITPNFNKLQNIFPNSDHICAKALLGRRLSCNKLRPAYVTIIILHFSKNWLNSYHFNISHLVIFSENCINIRNHFANIKHINVPTPVITAVMSMVIWRSVSKHHSLCLLLLQSILAKAFSSSSPSNRLLLSASCFLKYCISRELSSNISGLMYSSLIIDFKCLRTKLT